MTLPVVFLPEGGVKFTGYQGLASNGGALGVLIAIFFYSRKTKHSMIDTLDLIAVVAGLTGFEDGMTFNMGQVLSLPYIVVGIGFMIYDQGF